MDSTTAKLTDVLKNAADIRKVLKENEPSITSPTLKEYLKQLLSAKDMKRQDVIKAAKLDGNYANQLFNGRRTNPGREQVLSLAFGFGLNREEADKLLRAAGVGALYPKVARDAIIIHTLENKTPIDETNDILSELGHTTFPGYSKSTDDGAVS